MAKNGHNAKAIYSPCKILSLGQKIKLPKTCEKPLYNYIRVALCVKKTVTDRVLRARELRYIFKFVIA